MELTLSWWNCKLAPPVPAANKLALSDSHKGVVSQLLLGQRSDVLGLCEVNQENIDEIAELLKSPGFEHYGLINLYNSGRSIDDMCVVFDRRKLSVVGEPLSANVRDSARDTWLRAGYFVCFLLPDDVPFVVSFSHWQSRGSLSNVNMRVKLGDALRLKLDELRDEYGTNLLSAVCGDFNDEPCDDPIVYGVGACRDVSLQRKRSGLLFNPFWSIMASPDGATHARGSYIGDGGTTTAMLMLDHIMLSSGVVDAWDLLETSVIDEVPAKAWKKISDHYPVLVRLRRI